MASSVSSIRSCAAFPIALRGGLPVALGLCSDEAGYFDVDEVELLQSIVQDISHAIEHLDQEIRRREAEHDLKESEEKYHQLFEMESDALFLIDSTSGRIIEVNTAAERLYGYSREELLQKRNVDLSAEPDKTTRATQNEATRVPLRYHRKKDGTAFPIEITASHYTWRGLKVHLAAIRDITERMQAEETQRENEERLTLALAAANQGIFDLNVQTGNTVVTPEYATMLGYDPVEFHETNAAWIDRLHPEDRKVVAQVYQDYVEGKLPEYRVEFRQKTRSGDWKWILSLGRVIERDADGRPLRMLGTHTDIDMRKRAEAERERLMAAIEQAGETVLITDPTGTIQYVNPAFEAATGYTPREAIGQTPRLLKSGKQSRGFYGELWSVIASGRVWKGRMVNKRKDGTLFTEEATISPVRDASGQIVNYVAVKRDLTEELQLEAQLAQAQKMESVGRLAGGVAHDFNNMLGVILGNTELALMQTSPDTPLHESLTEVRKAARRSADLTRQLLAFARKQTIDPRPLNLNTTVEGMLKMLRRLIGEQIELSWHPGDALWLVNMDPAQIDQILANLCVNARDAIAENGRVTIETRNVTLDEAFCAGQQGGAPCDHVMLTVSDNGCGMDEETREHIFEPFFTTKELGKGTGLGLSTVYGIIKQNNGFIQVSAEPGLGTTFKIYIPRMKSEPLQPTQAGPLDLPLGHGETVLLVEDEVDMLNMTKRALERLGYHVLACAGPAEAIRLAREHAGWIALLMSDVVMPAMNGKELAEKLMESRPDLKCLYMSGYTADVIGQHGVLDRGVHFIQKPFAMQDLATKIREVLNAG